MHFWLNRLSLCHACVERTVKMRINFCLVLSRHNLGIYSADRRIRLNINEAATRRPTCPSPYCSCQCAIIVAIYIESCFKAIGAVYKLTGMSMVLMLLLKVQEKARSVLGLATIRHEISSVCCLLASNTVLVPGRHTGLSEQWGG